MGTMVQASGGGEGKGILKVFDTPNPPIEMQATAGKRKIVNGLLVSDTIYWTKNGFLTKDGFINKTGSTQYPSFYDGGTHMPISNDKPNSYMLYAYEFPNTDGAGAIQFINENEWFSAIGYNKQDNKKVSVRYQKTDGTNTLFEITSLTGNYPILDSLPMIVFNGVGYAIFYTTMDATEPTKYFFIYKINQTTSTVTKIFSTDILTYNYNVNNIFEHNGKLVIYASGKIITIDENDNVDVITPAGTLIALRNVFGVVSAIRQDGKIYKLVTKGKTTLYYKVDIDDNYIMTVADKPSCVCDISRDPFLGTSDICYFEDCYFALGASGNYTYYPVSKVKLLS